MDLIGPVLNGSQDLLLRTDPVKEISRLPGDVRSDTPEKLEEIAKKFEGIFLHQVLKQMKEATASLEEESEDASAEQIKGMYWDFWADAMTQQGGFGLWKQIYGQLSDWVAGASGPAGPSLDEQI